MKQKISEHINQLNIKNGGGIVSEKIRVGMIDNPMLVIGLGGTGIDALLRLKYMVNKRFELPRDQSKKAAEKPNGIEFIGIETNQAESTKKYPKDVGIGLDLKRELLLLSNASIGPMLKDKSQIDPCIKAWLHKDISPARGTDGAGGNRQLGRLMLFAKIDEVIEIIERKIKTLMTGKANRLIVFILSGLSGGTGSGCFLDIPYIIRGIMDKHFGTGAMARVEIFGYMFTPDVNLSKENIGNYERDYIMKNGYAALKELDYWMNIDDRKERFTQDYKGFISVNSQMPPFDLCHLISSFNKVGVPLEDAYDYCMNVTAENITNFMANEEREAGSVFAIQDYMSNIKMLVGGMNKPFRANYKYSILGASSAVLPIEEITTYLAYKLFSSMSSMFNNAPNEAEVTEFINQMRLDKESVSKRFDKDVQEPLRGFEQSPQLFSYDNVIKSDLAGVMSSLNSYLQKAEEKYLNVSAQLPDQAGSEIRGKVEAIFKDPKKGPFYVQRLLYSREGFNCIKTMKATIESINNELNKQEDNNKNLERASVIKFSEAKDKILFNKDKKKNEYLNARIKEFKAKATEKRLTRMREFYTRLIDIVTQYNNDIFEVITEILDRLNVIFKQNGEILTQSNREDNNGSTTYYWNIISVPQVSKQIDKIVNERKAEELIADFTTELLKESKSWIDESEVGIIDAISDFLSDKFGELISRSMEDFLRMEYGEEMNVADIAGEIADQLNRRAVPVFYLDNVNRAVNFPSWGMVSLPVKSPDIKEGIKEYQKNGLASRGFTIKESKVTNRIFWLNTENGVPLYTYSPLKIYEEAYEKGISTPEHKGRHLVQTEKEDWIDLPSPIPQDSWGEIYSNERVKLINEETKLLFERASQENPNCIINIQSGSGTSQYQCMQTVDFDINEFMKDYKIELDDKNKIKLSELNRCINNLSKILKDGLKVVNSYEIFDSTDEKAAKDNLIRTPRIIKLTRSELKKYDDIRAKLSELKEVLEELNKVKKEFKDFFEIMFTSTISKKGFRYVYDMEEGEKGEWPLFADAMKSKYVEYDIYKKFRVLDDRAKKILVDKAAKRFDKMTMDEQLIPNRIMELMPIYTEKVEKLKENENDLLNTDVVLELYCKISDELVDMKGRAGL